jgi:hypothetical protein
VQLGREALFAGAKKVGAFGAGAAVDDYLKTLMRRRLAYAGLLVSTLVLICPEVCFPVHWGRSNENEACAGVCLFAAPDAIPAVVGLWLCFGKAARHSW